MNTQKSISDEQIVDEGHLLRLRAQRGALILGGRQVAATLASVVGGIALARILEPSDFGYYALSLFVLAFVGSVGDGGLGASLIREPENPSQTDLRVTFTAQITLTLLLAIGIWVATPALVSAFDIESAGATLIRIAVLTPVIGTLKTVPTVILERELKFGAVGATSVIEILLFNVVAVSLALAGWGITSLGVGLVAGSIGGVAFLNWRAPWIPGLSLQAERLRHHLRFGLPYQGVALISILKDGISPVCIGLLAGATEVGYVEWSQRLAAYALIALFVLQRLLLTWFARLQERPDDLNEAVSRALRMCNALVAPCALGILAFAVPITSVVFGEKWLPALPVFWWLCAANLLVPGSVVAVAALNSLGHSRTTFKFALLWMLLTFVLGLPAILMWGFVGFGVANLLIQTSNFWLFLVAGRHFHFPWFRAAIPAWSAAVIACGLGIAAWWLVSASPGVRLFTGMSVLAVSYVLLVVLRPGPIAGWGEALPTESER